MKPTMKKWLTGLLSVALLAGNLPVYAVNTAYAAEEDGFFTDEAESFEGSLEEPEENPDGGQSEDSFASVSEFTGFTSGEAEEDFSGEEDFVAPDSQDGFEGEADPTTLLESDMQDEGGYLQNLTLYTSQSGVSTVALKRSADLDAEFGGKVYVAEYGSNMDSASFWITADLAGNAPDGSAIQLETTATTILTDENGKAVGVKAVGATGNEVTVNAKAVILATGGFGANLDMVAELVPALKGFMTTNAAGAQGQGIEMAQALDAATVDMDQIQIHPTVQFDTAALITEGLRGDGAVLINADGKRFIDEVGTRDVVSAAEIAQPGSYSYLVVDQAMLDKSSVIAGYVKRGFVFQGNTYEELAEALGVDAATFAETMNTWNTYVEAKNDPDFGRTSFAQPLNTAPYYAIKVTAGVHHTMGGLVINTDTEVLKADGTAIAGLYAAGEVTGGVHGANRLGGNAVADFVVFGRIAGEEAAEYALGE